MNKLRLLLLFTIGCVVAGFVNVASPICYIKQLNNNYVTQLNMCKLNATDIFDKLCGKPSNNTRLQ